MNTLRCELCDVACTGADAYAAHIRGSKHLKVLFVMFSQTLISLHSIYHHCCCSTTLPSYSWHLILWFCYLDWIYMSSIISQVIFDRTSFARFCLWLLTVHYWATLLGLIIWSVALCGHFWLCIASLNKYCILTGVKIAHKAWKADPLHGACSGGPGKL